MSVLLSVTKLNYRTLITYSVQDRVQDSLQHLHSSHYQSANLIGHVDHYTPQRTLSSYNQYEMSMSSWAE